MEVEEAPPSEAVGLTPSTPEDTLAFAELLALEGEHGLLAFGDGQRGVAPLAELGAAPAIGARFPVYVEEKGGDDRWKVSVDKGRRLEIWARIQRAFDAKEPIEGEVVAVVEGGFSVDLGTRAFLPASQIDLTPARSGDRYLGQRFLFRVIRLQRSRGNIVVSRRVLLEEARAKVFDKLQVGMAVDGTVRSFAEYGAFIDLGGVQGLLHISDMSWGKIGHPSEILTVGDRVRVKVLKLDPAAQRISLGLRQLQEDPWAEAERKYAVGKEVQGRIVAITDFGLFCELEVGVEGLVHTKGSLVPDVGRDVLRKLSIGDRITATVLEKDIAKKRISLAFKAAGRTETPQGGSGAVSSGDGST